MGSCCISELFDFIRNTDGIEVDRQNSFLYTNGVNDKRAIGGSNITILCQENYEMIGGSPTVLCTEENLWTPFPQCVPLPTLAEPDPSSLRCPIDADTWNLPNGYLSQSRNVLVYSDNTASGKQRHRHSRSLTFVSRMLGSVVFSCSIGYVVDSTTGGAWTCNEGKWSPRPYCISKCVCLCLEWSLLDNDR